MILIGFKDKLANREKDTNPSWFSKSHIENMPFFWSQGG